jgi:hypothetical protein
MGNGEWGAIAFLYTDKSDRNSDIIFNSQLLRSLHAFQVQYGCPRLKLVAIDRT